MGGDDTELGVGATERDELTLDDGDDFGASFDGHVATCDHDTIGGLDNFFEGFLGFDSFLGFDFRDNLGSGAERQEHLFEFDDVTGGLDEGEGNVVVIFLAAHFDVVEVFVGEDVATEVGVGKVEALAGHDEAVVFDFDFNSGVTDNFGNGGFDFAIEHREGLAGFDFAGEIVLDWHGHAAVVFETVVGFEDEFVTFL